MTEAQVLNKIVRYGKTKKSEVKDFIIIGGKVVRDPARLALSIQQGYKAGVLRILRTQGVSIEG
jgi:hypothetical protein